jgi:hypothetical protein
MLVNCIYAKKISCGGRCVECQLGIYGLAPDIDICHSVCQKKLSHEDAKIKQQEEQQRQQQKISEENLTKSLLKFINEEVPKNMESTDPILSAPEAPLDKFNTCIHRTPEQVSEMRRNCCQHYTINGYRCNRFGYFPLNEGVCTNCAGYENKSVNIVEDKV